MREEFSRRRRVQRSGAPLRRSVVVASVAPPVPDLRAFHEVPEDLEPTQELPRDESMFEVVSERLR